MEPYGGRREPGSDVAVIFSVLARITVSREVLQVSATGAPNQSMTTPERQERFRTLLDSHKGILYKVCHSYCQDRHDREDLAQEIIMQLWLSFRRFDEQYRFSTWMYRIALNVAISFYRRESVRTHHLISDERYVLGAIDETKGEPEDVQLLYKFIEKLDELDKALVLLYLDGNSYEEIAGVLGITQTNVATKLNRLTNRWNSALSEKGR